MSTPPPAPVEKPVASSAAAPARLDARSTVGAYELLLELASGGMAMVYLGRATDGRANAPLVAVKRPHRHLATDKNFLAMLIDEARLASAIAHENVVKVRELSFHEGEPFIVMDYVEGASLSELRKELAASERAFDLRIALRIVLDALAGLHAAHELCDASGKHLAIVHRDISPHNVLVGSDGRARVTDFGIAHASDRLQETRTHEVKGKLAYLAPERVDKRRLCTRQSDVFSMAIVLWECLAGRRLFRGDQAVDTLQEVMHAPIPRLRQIGREISPALDDVIARALSRDLDVRFATALEFETALRGAAGPGSIGQSTLVAQLIEALYGPRIAELRERVRVTVEDDRATEQLFRDAGLAPRPEGISATESATEALRAFAPPAPSERYVFGQGLPDFRTVEKRRTRWAVVGGVAGGLVLGVGLTLFVAMRGPSGTKADGLVRAKGAARLPTVAHDTPASSANAGVAAATLAPPPSTRRAVLPLAFLATHATVDGAPFDIFPAADTLSVDVPADSGPRHHVVETALDGLELSADVDEVGREGAAPSPSAVSPAPPLGSSKAAAPAPSSRRIGVVRNGFTRLN